jgi:hypothetical protein
MCAKTYADAVISPCHQCAVEKHGGIQVATLKCIENMNKEVQGNIAQATLPVMVGSCVLLR